MLLAKSSYIIGEMNVTVSLLTRKEKSVMVFVLDTNKKPLAPCHPARARKLLKTGKVQGINHKYCQIVQKSDGYKYTLERSDKRWLI